MIVEDEEVAHALEFPRHVRVVAFSLKRVIVIYRKQFNELRYCDLRQMNARRFKRFQETASQPDADAVMSPELFTPAGCETQRTWIGQGRAFQIVEQGLTGRLIIDEIAGIDMPVPGAVLQRDPPLPARLMCGCTRVGRGWSGFFARQGDSPVARQPA